MKRCAMSGLTVTTWTFVDPEKVTYPSEVEEDGYDSDDDLMTYDEGLKSRRMPLPAKTVLRNEYSDRTEKKVLRIPHCYRANCFSVDGIPGQYEFEGGKSWPTWKPEKTRHDHFFVTGYNLNRPAPDAEPAEKRGWFESFLLRVAEDYRQLSLKKLNERLMSRELSDELGRLEYLCKTVVEDFLAYLDLCRVWRERRWLTAALECVGSVTRSTYVSTLHGVVISAGVLSFINRSYTGKALLLALNAHVVFRYLPVFYPRRTESVLQHKVKLTLVAGEESIADAFEENFRTVWESSWPYDDCSCWRLSDEMIRRLRTKVECDEQLMRLDEMARLDGKLIFGFAPIVPFRLEAKHRDFVQSDVFRELGSLEQAKYKVYAKLKALSSGSGSTYFSESHLFSYFQPDLSRNDWVTVVDWLTEKGVTVIQNHDPRLGCNGRTIMLKKFYDAEWGIARGIRKLYETTPNPSLEIDINSEAFEIFRSDPDQLAALNAFSEHPLIVLNGSAGSGKTQVVSAYVKAALEKLRVGPRTFPEEEQPPIQVLLSAPTGKAASVLGKRIGQTAFTLHSIKQSFASKSGGAGFHSVKVWVVDECSMVPIVVFNQVFNCLLEMSSLCKVILIGDKRQLPSVDPGNFLVDLYDGMLVHAPRFCVDLKTNHRSEAQVIVTNAQCIINGDVVSLDLRHESVFRIRDLKPEECFGLPWDRRLSLTDVRSSQIISFTNDVVGVYNEEALNYYRTSDKREFIGDRRNPRKEPVFIVNDKVICTRNADVRILSEQPRRVLKLRRLSNGMQYIILEDCLLPMQGVDVERGDESSPDVMPVSRVERFLKLDDMGGEVILAHYTDIVKKAKLRIAWALTVHKFQGSETDHVTYALTGNKYETNQLVYTAVTRGRKSVTLIGTRRQLEDAIVRPPISRRTILKHCLADVFSSPAGQASRLRLSLEDREEEVEIASQEGPLTAELERDAEEDNSEFWSNYFDVPDDDDEQADETAASSNVGNFAQNDLSVIRSSVA